uniref:Photosystem II reaction center protein Psb30 n=2 Tax=Avrainvillea TaxID=336841 RepID=A0A1X9RPX2_9CHLO|nr:photosystem II protein psb30 [Avrainvillea mazei]AYJ22379.1 photosystem II protein psb30 [Avrainvillea sp. HV04061]
MNFEILSQLISLFLVVATGPIVIILLASRDGNL